MGLSKYVFLICNPSPAKTVVSQDQPAWYSLEILSLKLMPKVSYGARVLGSVCFFID